MALITCACYMCMLDTGARYSTLNTPLPPSRNTLPVIGFSGNTEEWPLSTPVQYQWRTLTFEHSNSNTLFFCPHPVLSIS